MNSSKKEFEFTNPVKLAKNKMKSKASPIIMELVKKSSKQDSISEPTKSRTRINQKLLDYEESESDNCFEISS